MFCGGGPRSRECLVPVLRVLALLDRRLAPRCFARRCLFGLHVFCEYFAIANALTILSYPILFNPILSYPVLSYPIQS